MASVVGPALMTHYGCRPEWGGRTTWSTPKVEAEESGETEGAVLRYIATAEDQRLAEAAMREFHDRVDTYTRGLAREYLR